MKKLLENKHATIIGAVAVIAFVAVMAIQGCDLKRMIKFDVPRGVQKTVDVGEQESLASAEAVYQQWSNFVDSNSRQLSANIEDAEGRLSLINSLTSMGISAIGDASSGFPGGAIMMSALSLLTGWFLKRPGEEKRVNVEKEDSYNAGLEMAKELMDEE